ncbi:hypothetical protein GCM10010873_16500 [Cypionkella aquatica]|uniref:Acb2/Tad1 hairpin domain-containing protein n=1 Tax=Cypionkella aquatica TaxID=1756042 RepID=A0AA37X378_9RHOB|nr:hypothetical protein GCM10010873_16500 [Cypionkella aquatica]
MFPSAPATFLNPEARMTPMNSVEHAALPVHGCRPQPAAALERVNAMKQIEERVLRALDELKEFPETDQRWLATGRTDIEKGFMAVDRSVFKPSRVEIVE